ncbi:transcriptional regulator [Streptomyces sp. MK5]|uniref:transcriptional regulator n=1 Tax=Streptomyces sp. MK5 TaxID=3064253 RepID=UPI002740D620|nr:transcriptional regulator [Streptomyces sp. MK5]
MAPTPSVPEVRRGRFARRLPATLAELTGPAHGTVGLPLHLAWSGPTRFDLDRPRLRMSCYRIVPAEGQHDDLTRHLNRDLLIKMSPVLRTLIGRDIRDLWEDAFPELAQHFLPPTSPT